MRYLCVLFIGVIFLSLKTCKDEGVQVLLENDNIKYIPNSKLNKKDDFIVTKADGFMVNIRGDADGEPVHSLILNYTDSSNHLIKTWSLNYPHDIHNSIIAFKCFHSNDAHSFIYGQSEGENDSLFIINNKNGIQIETHSIPDNIYEIFLWRNSLIKANENSVLAIDYLTKKPLWNSKLMNPLEKSNSIKLTGPKIEDKLILVNADSTSIFFSKIDLKNGQITRLNKFVHANGNISLFNFSSHYTSNGIGIHINDKNNSQWLQFDKKGHLLWKRRIPPTRDYFSKRYPLSSGILIQRYNNGTELILLSNNDGKILWKDKYAEITDVVLHQNNIYLAVKNKIIILNAKNGQKISSWEFSASINCFGFYKNHMIFLSKGKLLYKNFDKYLSL